MLRPPLQTPNVSRPGRTSLQPSRVGTLGVLVMNNTGSDDELFSILGAYELARVTLPHDSIVWGP